MHEFRVWAPLSGRVEVVLGDRRLPMARAASGSAARGSVTGGWWACSVDEAGPGTDYAFSLDGGPPRPDPRSAFQPRGIHGPSQVVDHSAFRWSDSDWRGVALPGCVLYECHIGTFSAEGTFDGAIEHLGHLVDLGVDAIELLPVAEFSGARGWGYDGVDLFAPHHGYGGPDGLKRLVDAAHGHGLGVVMDVVYNHLGPAGNYLPEFGPYFSARHQTNWGDAVNFDGPGSDEVRRFVTDNALAWLRDYHCDGLRLDAVHAIVDDSATHILEALAAKVDALAAHVRAVGAALVLDEQLTAAHVQYGVPARHLRMWDLNVVFGRATDGLGAAAGRVRHADLTDDGLVLGPRRSAIGLACRFTRVLRGERGAGRRGARRRGTGTRAENACQMQHQIYRHRHRAERHEAARVERLRLTRRDTLLIQPCAAG